MNWIIKAKTAFRTNKPPKAPLDAIRVEQEQEAVQTAEQKEAKELLTMFTNLGHTMYFFDSISKTEGAIAVNDVSSVKQKIDNIEKAFINMKIYEQKIITLAERLEADLLDIRGGESTAKQKSLTTAEHHVLQSAQKMGESIVQGVALVRALHDIHWEETINTGYFSPKNKIIATEAYHRMNQLYVWILHIQGTITNVIELEKEVDELTKKFVSV